MTYTPGSFLECIYFHHIHWMCFTGGVICGTEVHHMHDGLSNQLGQKNTEISIANRRKQSLLELRSKRIPMWKLGWVFVSDPFKVPVGTWMGQLQYIAILFLRLQIQNGNQLQNCNRHSETSFASSTTLWF